MLKRKIEAEMEAWRTTKTTQGFLVTGARQIGKTYSIEAFGREHYDSTVKIDFVEQPRAIEVIGAAQDLDDLLLRITSLSSQPLSEGKTLLFFDEVQRCADAITWMRYLAQDSRFDVIYSGSMLGIEAYDFRSLPVGTIDILEMFPSTSRSSAGRMDSMRPSGTPHANASRRARPFPTSSTKSFSTSGCATSSLAACPSPCSFCSTRRTRSVFAPDKGAS